MMNLDLLYPFIVLWALLCFGSLAVFFTVRLRPDKDYTELKQRTLSWWFMIAAFSFAVLSSQTISVWFLCFISFLAFKEYLSMIPTRRADRGALFFCYLSIPLQYYWAQIGWYGMFIIFIPVYMFLLSGFLMVIAQQTEGFLKAAGTIHWGLMTCVFSLSHAAFLMTLPDHPLSNNAGGSGLLFFLVFLCQFNDVAQYVWGKLFGKHKISPIVSPKKTWQGFIGGIITTTVLSAIIYPYLTPFSVWAALFSGIMISTFGFVGDICISAVKRDLGVKDFGSLIPGHGGILDRIDSLTFTAPLFFHFTWYFYY